MKVPKRVVLLGRGTGGELHTRKRFTHKIWACFSAVQAFHNKIHLVFGADPLEVLVNSKGKKADNVAMRLVVMDRCQRQNIPIFLPKVYPEHPTSMAYPLREIVKKFGITYFSNTVCYMVAYAVYIGVKQLDLYGINMDYGSEYEHEKGGLEFWLGFAMGKGIKVKVHGEKSMVLKTKVSRHTKAISKDGNLYGYDCDSRLKGGIVKVL